MAFKTKILDEFAHKGLKILDALNSQLEMYDLVPTGGLKDAGTRRNLSESINALAQAIQDLRVLVNCEEISPEAQQEFDWKDLVTNNLKAVKRRAPNISLKVEEESYAGFGHVSLLGSVVGNLGWFSSKFASSSPVQVHLSSFQQNHEVWVKMVWDFGQAFTVSPEFAEFREFYYMNPKEGLTLPKSTGLILFTAKRIAELQGGSLSANINGHGVQIEFRCPQDRRRLRT